ncbi:hypothetical protein PWT90_08468 [Aphanocladium album]|nr:hypothetical protein PWT90_08468 [Aphanocladium album]
MRFTSNLLALVAAAALGASAAPADNLGLDAVQLNTETSNAVNSPLSSNVNVYMYAGDTCNGQVSQFSLENGGNRCVPVPFAVRSIRAPGHGCSVSTWSGNNCRGSHYNVNDDSCHSVLYGSVYVQC